ncbi:MAG: recombinase family protein [Phycisphaerales bacterium]
MNHKSGSTTPKTIRCAIYTRKSSEEGLEQEFNSLDAQRESAEAFIASQKAQGWVCLPEQYNDGGFSGGSLERPAMDRLMRDIEAGKIDCVVVYKVDRLSRSLMDFSKIMESFDANGVSFVSVTQQFNTTSSMGRLTLNILLSFAQFEREIIGERIRDKIAAQKRKGKWTGGVPMLGYDVDRSTGSPKLVVNAAEASRIRAIFDLYLEKQSLQPVCEELRLRDWRNKKRVTAKGKPIGDRPFDKSTLYNHLTNPIYTGKITHKGDIYEGEHEAIIKAEVFERVQKTLKHNGRTGGAEVRNKYGALLRGILRCKGCDHAMTHVFTTARGKRSRQYRYYRCVGAIKKGAAECNSGSLPAPEIEQLVIEEVRELFRDPSIFEKTIEQATLKRTEDIQGLELELSEVNGELANQRGALTKLIRQPSDDQERVTELQGIIAANERRAERIRDRLESAQGEQIDSEAIGVMLGDFDEVWSNLIPREQARLLKLLIEKVEYDAEGQCVQITYRPNEFEKLADLQQNQEAA